jgi:hypothetical protein
MRLRFNALACALAALACAAGPGIASAAPAHDRGLTIRAVPHRIIAGESVLIYGQLTGADHGGQPIRLYSRINPDRGFALIAQTTTNAAGQYEFPRANGIVLTNRSWYVRGPDLTHSRTVHERVAALVSLAASAPSGITRHPLVFSGHVTPADAHGAVFLQQQTQAGDRWHTIKRGFLDAGSDYNIPYAWRVPGAYDLRVVFRGDVRNAPAPSDLASVVIQQSQVADFTINSSSPIVANDQPATIAGTLYEPGTTTPEPDTGVSLFEAAPRTHAYREVTSTTTGSDGSYSFTVSSTANQLYRVRTTFAPARSTAVLFEGVQDSVSVQASTSTSMVGGHVTFAGTVSPDHAGQQIYLQKLGADSAWHTVEVRRVGIGSTFQFGWTFGAPGTKEFRARITGDQANLGGVSAPATVDVSLPPLSTLPTG